MAEGVFGCVRGWERVKWGEGQGVGSERRKRWGDGWCGLVRAGQKRCWAWERTVLETG